MSVDELTDLLRASSAVVAFSGAGISTESGIPDFRSPGGVWTRYDPRDLTFDRYVDDVEVRTTTWAMRRELFGADPKPNAAHRALADLQTAGCLHALITQNIDGLHTDAGCRDVIEVHGTAREVGCIGAAPRGGRPDGCGWREHTSWAFEAIDAGTDDPRCPGCGGLVKSATISFGQQLDPSVLEAAAEATATGDLFITIGSSLQVHPAAGLPELAVREGVPLVIVNDEATPFDGVADLVVRGRAGEVLGPAVTAALA